MFETCVTLLNDNELYPKTTELCHEVGYSRFKGIPLWSGVERIDHKKNTSFGMCRFGMPHMWPIWQALQKAPQTFALSSITIILEM